MKHHLFRFGVICERMSSYQAWVNLARTAEQSGYATLLLRDHFLREPFGDQFAPIAALMAAASVTSTLRVGTLVFAHDYRHPVILAKEAATLDLLSGGRFELGLGAGFLKEEYERAGIMFDPAGVRISRLEEAIRVLKGLFAEEPLTFSGKHYTITNLNGFPKPVQRPHPPLLIGAGGKRMLSLAARVADIINILPVSVTSGTLVDDPAERSAAAVAEKIAWVRQAAAERFHEIELNTIIRVVITQDRRQAAEDFAQKQGWSGVPVEQILDMPSILIGSPDQVIEEIYRRRERYGFSYYIVRDENMEAFTPIVAQLTGK